MRFLAGVLLVVPLAALAERTPFVVKGPVIVGVRPTEAWVTWETSHHQGKATKISCPAGTPNGKVPTLTLLAPDGKGPSFEDPSCSRQHKVHLTSLKPGTPYRFTLDRPFSGGAAAEGAFHTPPDKPEGTVHFVVYGDNRDNPVNEPSTRPGHEAVVKAILAHEPDADFLLHTGDAALNVPAVSGEDRGYAEFFEVERPLLASRPVEMAFGNHESIDPSYYDALLSGAALAKEAHPFYFSFDWGPVHVAVLDAFENPPKGLPQREPGLSDAQARWLDGDLAAAKAKGLKLFLLSHQGAYSHGENGAGHGGGPDVQKKVVPLMIKYGVLGLFAGHDHYYQRGREGCTGYYVVGAGGAPEYKPDPKAPGVAKVHEAPSYLAVTVGPDGAHAEGREANGEVFDRFDFAPAGCPATDAGK